MLEFFRQNVKSWLFVVLIVLIVASFALFGINEFLVDKSDAYIATVDGEEIPIGEYQNALRNAQAQGELSVEQKEDLVEQLISQRLLLDGLGELNLRPSDQAVSAQVLAEPAFQNDGRFDQERYVNALKLRGYSVAAYEEGLRNSLSFSQFTSAIEDTALNFFTDSSIATITQDIQQQLQQRAFTEAVLGMDLITATTTVTDADVQSYYDVHTDQYRLGQGIKLAYVQLNASDYGNTPTESAIEQFYQSHIGSFTSAPQQDMSYIVVSNSDGMTDAQVAMLDQAVSRYSGSGSFTALTSMIKQTIEPDSLSIDTGNIGSVDQSIIADLYSDTVATRLADLDEQAISGLRTSERDYTIFYVNAIVPGKVVPLADAKADIAQQLMLEDAYPKLAQAQEALEIAAFENPLSLQPAADAVGKQVQISDWIYEDGSGDSVLRDIEKARAYAFSESANANGYNSDIFEIDQGVMIVRFAEEKAPSVKPLAEVSPQIRSQLLTDKRQTLLSDRATVLINQALELDDSSSEAVVDWFKGQGLAVSSSEVPMDEQMMGAVYDPTFSKIVFALDEGLANVRHFPASAETRKIVWVTDIVDIPEDSPMLASQMARINAQQQQQVGRQEENSLLDLYREKADVIINTDQL